MMQETRYLTVDQAQRFLGLKRSRIYYLTSTGRIPFIRLGKTLLFDTHDLGKALPGVVIACIGSVTATAAVEYGLRVDIQPPQFTVKDLAEAIAGYYEISDRHE